VSDGECCKTFAVEVEYWRKSGDKVYIHVKTSLVVESGGQSREEWVELNLGPSRQTPLGFGDRDTNLKLTQTFNGRSMEVERNSGRYKSF
jgi:hypothetical protein